MTRRALVVAAGVLVAATASPGAVRAQNVVQDVATPHDNGAPVVRLTAFGALGPVVAHRQPGFDRGAGVALAGGIEVARPGGRGVVRRLALRAEVGVAAQPLRTGQTVVTGDVQTTHAALAVRANAGQMLAHRLTTFVEGGVLYARPSTRFELAEDPTTTPGARYRQVTHENVPGALLGVGASWRVGRVLAAAEVRWLSLATSGRSTTSYPVLLTVAIPVPR